MQGVYASGATNWTVPTFDENGEPDPYGDYQAYKLRGVVISDPRQMLDTTADYREGPFKYMGGQWQIYVQAETGEDFGGVALYLAQNYGNFWSHYPDWNYNYINGEWENEAPGFQADNEMDRLNYPSYTSTTTPVSEPLRAGDIVEIHARGGLSYKGKFNCNEQHTNGCDGLDMDFDIYLIQRNSALPLENIELNDVYVDPIFDPTRQSGGELYQGQRVRLQNVTISNPGQWGLIDPDSIAPDTNDPGEYYTIHVTDATQTLTFDIVLGENDSFVGTTVPTGPLDIIGVFDQDATDNVCGTDGYRMWALSPDDFLKAGLLPGDANMDDVVDDRDATIMATNWGKPFSDGAKWRHGDFSGDGQVNQDDAALLAEHWLQTPASDTAVPEPGMLLLLSGCGLMFWVLRKRDINTSRYQ